LNLLMHLVLFEERKQLNERTDPIGLYAPKPASAVGKYLEGVGVIVHRDAELFEMVRALHPPRSLAGRLDRGQEQCHQDANDCNHDEQLDECEASSRAN
jgi:hypothetical protein